LTDSIETSLKLSTNGTVIIDCMDGKPMVFSGTAVMPPHCGVSYDELSPRMFSFNSPFGAAKPARALVIC